MGAASITLSAFSPSVPTFSPTAGRTANWGRAGRKKKKNCVQWAITNKNLLSRWRTAYSTSAIGG